MDESFWIMISALATAAMAIATFATFVMMKKQHKEAVRARLIFSIVRKDSDVYLKIANIGNSVATDIHIKFSQNFKDMLLADAQREKYASLEQTSFSIDAQEAKYYSIIPVEDSEAGGYFKFGEKERFTQTQVNEWHKMNDKVVFEISGTYYKNQKFHEQMSIYAFLNVGAVEINEVASVMRRQNEIFKGIKNELESIARR